MPFDGKFDADFKYVYLHMFILSSSRDIGYMGNTSHYDDQSSNQVPKSSPYLLCYDSVGKGSCF